MSYITSLREFGIFSRWLVKHMAVLPVSEFVPSDLDNFLAKETARRHWYLKLLRRKIVKTLLGQRFNGKKAISPFDKRILWISLCAPSLGDVLMDVSGRSLLGTRSIDLLTSKEAADLLKTDKYFSQVSSSISEVKGWANQSPYDLVIVDSYSTRSLRIKASICRSTPHVSMFGYVNGFEVHRIKYSFARMRRLLNDDSPAIVLPRLALDCARTDISCESKYPIIVLGIGGNWKFRSYQQWDAVLRSVKQSVSQIKVLLVGSENGSEIEHRILSQGLADQSFVNQLTITETASVISQAQLFVGADGGLWHVSWNLGVKSVCLFADCDLFDKDGSRLFRDLDQMNCVTIYDDQNVNNISPSLIANVIVKQLSESDREGQAVCV